MLTRICLVSILAAQVACGAALASVMDCELIGAEGDQGRLTTYEFDGVMHSAFVELSTTYGDTLPFVFVCEEICRMEMNSEPYQYQLAGYPSIESPAGLVLLTESTTDDFRHEQVFEAIHCAIRENE